MTKPSLSLAKESPAGKENLKDYNSVAGLKHDQLKKLCRSYNIDVKLPKKARIVLLCHLLGISTTGHEQSLNGRGDVIKHLTDSQRVELVGITPAYMCQLTDWKKDIAIIPDIEETSVKKYLINTEVLNANNARTYKISRPYALQQFVHSVMFNDNSASETFAIVRAQCNPSQSTNPDDIKVVFAIIDKYLGEPYGGFCTCTVGNSERCGHIGAVLFKLAELQATGAVEGPSCTEVLCRWSDPKGSKVEPTVFQDLKIRKRDASIRRTIDDYGQKVTNQAPPTYDEVVELRASLIAATHHTGQYCPAVHVLNCDRFKPPGAVIEPVNITSEMPQTLPYHSAIIAPSKEVEVKTTPVVISQLVSKRFSSVSENGYKEACEELYSKAEKLDIDIKEVNTITKGQSSNPEWNEQRRGAITGTKFSSVIKAIEKKKSCDSLVNGMLETKYDKLKNVAAVKWGRKNECKARQAYVNKYEKYHKDFRMEEHGLLVYKECQFIRGSPDGIITCSCHGRILVEIKCPFSARMMTVTEGVKLGKIKYLELVNGRLQLKESTADGYYAQVQGLMGIAGIQSCTFIVWTTRDMVSLNIHFNKEFFLNKLVPSCKEFFRVHIIPRLLLKEKPVESESELGEITFQSNSDSQEIYIATPLEVTAKPVSVEENQPPKRKRVTVPNTAIVRTSSASPPRLVIPTMCSSAIKNTTAARSILAETIQVTSYRCASCRKVLPEDNIAPDNSNASVGCDCPNCGGCDVWMCWPCAKYDEEWADAGDNWYCPACTRECDIVY